jgi:hypothetical protein
MSKFIILHKKDTNEVIGFNVDEIVCFTSHSNTAKNSAIYLKDEEDTIFEVNEKTNDIIKKIGDSRNFIILHSVASNDEIAIPSDIISRVYKSTNGNTVVVITNLAFAGIDVNESVTSIIDRLNQ